MKQLLFIVCTLAVLAGCKNKKQAPDVSGIEVTLKTERFEKDLFEIDTLDTDKKLQALYAKYPGFTQDFIFNILGTSPDSAVTDIPLFVRSYHAMYLQSKDVFKDFTPIEKEIKKGLQFVRYYFPAYKLPGRLVTFIGPVNSYGNIITQDALAIGLQLYMGSDYPMYLSNEGQQLYPLYISRKFQPAYIPVNCMKNIIDDMYPNNSIGRPLVEQMIESGKRLYLLDRLLPETADTLKTGYTQKQLDNSFDNEKNIWSFFIQNDMLFNTDPVIARDYTGESPNTEVFGKESPGNIGQFIGMQIVTKWMDKNPAVTPEGLMKTPSRKIFDEAKYKP